MGNHYNPLEKEFLIRQYRSNPKIKLNDFCEQHNVSNTSLRKWLRQYDEGGLEGLVRADKMIQDVLPEGIDRTEESYKREILKLRIENERLKKNYTVRKTEAGGQEYARLKPKNTKNRCEICPRAHAKKKLNPSSERLNKAHSSKGLRARHMGMFLCSWSLHAFASSRRSFYNAN